MQAESPRDRQGLSQQESEIQVCERKTLCGARSNFGCRDISWDLEKDRHACLHKPDVDLDAPKYTPSAVRRVGQIFNKPVFFEDGVCQLCYFHLLLY